jgi:hypothetical protein
LGGAAGGAGGNGIIVFTYNQTAAVPKVIPPPRVILMTGQILMQKGQLLIQ